ncbi:MAG TPA: DNA primase catalytic subunit PriS [Methanocorpusculum sp.]|nr:DNA primase catalytic subunit PriS [Methanocorpusculum sp.]
MKPATIDFVKKRFATYYNGNLKGAGAVYTPTSMEQREWGFLFFNESVKSGMRRHLAFSSADDLQTYLKAMTPAHVYYSTAYYAHPSAPQMADKGWLGAELIFDLDADHILHAPYDVMLSRVKDELFKLIDMLTGELGFNRNDLKINFSGGRGYHVHIPLLSVRDWNSSERRELTNYVSGTGITSAVLFADGEYVGWKKRFAEAAEEELARVSALPPADAQSYLMAFPGFTERNALLFTKMIPALTGKLKQNPSSLKDNNLLKAVLNPETNPQFREKLLARAAQADEPVTTDIKRLIRHPGSLHGGSGMRVVPLDLDDLADFDPLVDAVVFGETPVTVTCSFPLEMKMLGNTYTLEKGVNKVPEALGMFLCCRGIAEYGSDA